MRFVETYYGILKKKKMAKFGNCSQIRLDPPTLANLGILNYYFFIADLASVSHDQDFKHNLFFSHTKVHQYLEKFPKCYL